MGLWIEKISKDFKVNDSHYWPTISKYRVIKNTISFRLFKSHQQGLRLLKGGKTENCWAESNVFGVTPFRQLLRELLE